MLFMALCMYINFSKYTHQLMNTKVDSIPWQLCFKMGLQMSLSIPISFCLDIYSEFLNHLVDLLLGFFYCLFIYLYVHTLFGPSLLPVPSLSPPPPSLPGRTCSVFFTSFVEEKTSDNKKDKIYLLDNKKDKIFLLVWDKDSYTERFLALLPCTSVLQPKLIHLYLTFSLIPGHLPILTSVTLRLLY
jgi:hypothetical protein